MTKMTVVILLAGLLAAGACSRKQPAGDPVADRDRKFQESMLNVTLVGRSTSARREGLSGEERYVIEKVSKLAGNTWLFTTRLKYGEREIPVPIPITIEWAGDTPVITLTDLAIPGVGTYTARVLLYRDHYAGTWSGKTNGGQLFGKIVHNATR